MKKAKEFKCTQCKEKKPIATNGGTGYGVNKKGQKVCYLCIGQNDLKELQNAQPGQRFTHYLTMEDGKYILSNWPGTFKKVVHVSKGSHNIARTRYDSHFAINGVNFHGFTIGDNTQIHHIKALKKR